MHREEHGRPGQKALQIALGITTAFLAAEVVGGILTHSLSLLADAGHMLTDFASGQLSPDDGLKVLEEIEKSEEPSEELALVPNIINFFKRQNAGILAKKPWPLRSSGGSDT